MKDYLKQTRLKDYYERNFPWDELGADMRTEPTFHDLLETLETGKSVYKLIGFGDSIVRERLFEALANKLNKEYADIYNLWIEHYWED